ncbi:DEAD/DEAH box helicase [Ilumatobacter coccineus]|uniref:ATP-dependent RNA helicase DeaD n=2 Tax=Ilumatobacter coccineus TaxID=467094 RepID=A0A6C7E2H6_ILUCY|nr:DEAD/DEAH box helicase [Ilumatobacter coccineus]BAN01030.1 ATP-dependent RNA helicase DeaD [Ilumatobacter coccineus YM16-304]
MPQSDTPDSQQHNEFVDGPASTENDDTVAIDAVDPSNDLPAPTIDDAGPADLTPPTATEEPAAESAPAPASNDDASDADDSDDASGDDDDGDDDGDDTVRFSDLGLSDELLSSLTDLGYEIPTPIQAESIPPLLDGFDLLGQAATGTGKTAAFALPMLDRVAGAGKSKIPFGLVLVPTRELANQVAEATKQYGANRGVRIAALFGGTNIGPQFSLLKSGVDIVIGTPGRVLDHLKRGSLDLSRCAMVVLDEADEMLDMGFAEDLEAILDAAPPERQTVLFSATMPNRIDSIASRQLSDPVRISIKRATETDGTPPKVRQTAYLSHRTHRASALARILDMESPEAAIVFCRTRGDVDELVDVMNGRGYRAEALHGGMSQDQRDRAMGRLKNGIATLLIATDVAARGIDVDHLSHVVNYDIPQTTEAYTHRIGRVGRAGREGIAITLGGPKDHRKINNIARYTGQPIAIEKVPTVNDLTAKRMEITRNEVAEKLNDTESADLYRSIVESLTADNDPIDVAIAAVRLAHETSGRTSVEQEIPDVSSHADKGKKWDDRGKGQGHRGQRDRNDRGSGKSFENRAVRNSDGSHHVEAGFVSLQFNLGRSAGVRPGDLVGAIANESNIRGNEIGAIKINDKSAFVQVPEKHAGKVLRSMDGAKIRNKPVRVRRANN